MLTIKEAVSVLRSYELHCSEQTLRRWLHQDRIHGTPPRNRRDGWRIAPTCLVEFLIECSHEGTALEYGIDDETRIERLMEEVYELRLKNEQLVNEIAELQAKLDVIPF